MKRYPLLGLLAVLAVGCSGSRQVAYIPPSAGFPNHSVEEIVQRLPPPDSLWGSFAGDLAIAYSMPGDRGTVNARVSYRRADSVLMRFRAPLGLEVSRALVTQDSMFVYDRVARKLYVGERGVADAMLPIGFWRSDVAAAVFGFETLDAGGWELSTDSTWYVLTRGDRTVIVDPGPWRIIASDTRDASGMLVDQRRFTDFERIDGLYVPRRIVTSRPDQDVRASITIRRLTPDPDRLSFDLGLRSDVERVPVY
ncbi:MAG: DUF4292 domain-containing protein [Rhodothermales bacterium]|nr:DUF4292 domain-containing protein [Rhodothermales bacterium]MBO6780254.1 DUF4292 domain-containing protein [Rhodothermales bacterium]